MHSASFFKTNRSRALPMLKSKQINVFWHLDDINKIEKNAIFQNRRRPQGNTNKNGKSYNCKTHNRNANFCKKWSSNTELPKKYPSKKSRRTSNTREIIPQIGSSNTEQPNCFIVSGSSIYRVFLFVLAILRFDEVRRAMSQVTRVFWERHERMSVAKL